MCIQVGPSWCFQNGVQSEKFLPPGGKIDHSMVGGWPSIKCVQLNSNCISSCLSHFTDVEEWFAVKFCQPQKLTKMAKSPKGLVKEIFGGPMVMSYNLNLGKCIQVGPLWCFQNRVQSEKFLPPGGKIDHFMVGGCPSNNCVQLNSNCISSFFSHFQEAEEWCAVKFGNHQNWWKWQKNQRGLSRRFLGVPWWCLTIWI